LVSFEGNLGFHGVVTEPGGHVDHLGDHRRTGHPYGGVLEAGAGLFHHAPDGLGDSLLVIDVFLDQEGLNGPVLIDGRNRREACRRVSVIPDYVLLDGQDPVAYILSANINRRHLSKGQRAMLIAMLYPDPGERGRGKKSLLSKDFNVTQLEFSGSRLSQARTVLRYAPDLLDSVRIGAMTLNKAYEEARLRKGRAETYESRFNALKAAAPDLADLVVEERLTLEEAHVALDERLSQIRREKLGSPVRDWLSLPSVIVTSL
jgi:hypothetical protein